MLTEKVPKLVFYNIYKKVKKLCSQNISAFKSHETIKIDYAVTTCFFQHNIGETKIGHLFLSNKCPKNKLFL